MSILNHLSSAQLVRLIDTKKRFVMVNLETNQVTFTNNYKPSYDGDRDYYKQWLEIYPETAQSELEELYKAIYRLWGFKCYMYESFEEFVYAAYGLSEHQLFKLKKYCEG